MTSAHSKGVIDPKYVTKIDKGVEIHPLAFNIAWGGDGRYYHKGTEREPVELIQVSWIEIDGSYDFKELEPHNYKLRFEVSMKPDAFGWSSPVYAVARVRNERYLYKRVDLSQNVGQKNFLIPSEGLEFEVKSHDDKLTYGLYEIWHNNWKGGLSIHKVIIEAIDDKKASGIAPVLS